MPIDGVNINNRQVLTSYVVLIELATLLSTYHRRRNSTRKVDELHQEILIYDGVVQVICTWYSTYQLPVPNDDGSHFTSC